MKLVPGLFFILIICSCNDPASPVISAPALTNQHSDTTVPYKLRGSWIRHTPAGFTLIEIMDSAHVMYYQYLYRQIASGSSDTDRHWYYKSAATLGEKKSGRASYIWIKTDRFLFDYQMINDTLIEYDKTGEHGKFIKVN